MCLNKIAIAQYFHVKLYFFFVSVDNWHPSSTVQIHQSVPTTSLLWGGSTGTPSWEEISCGSICGSHSWVGLIGGPFPGTFPRPRELWLTAAQCFFFFWSCHILSVQSSLALFDSRWLNVYWKGRKWTRLAGLSPDIYYDVIVFRRHVNRACHLLNDFFSSIFLVSRQ